VTRAVDQGLPVDAARIASLVGQALASGQLDVKRAQGELAVTAGQIRLNNARAAGHGADLALTGALDLTLGTVDSRLILTGIDQTANAKPDIFLALRGPIASPDRTIDVSAFTGWLTLRSVERQSKKLESIEASPPVQPMEPAAPINPPPQPEQVAPAPAPKPARPAPPPARTGQAPPAAQTGQAPPLPPPLNIIPNNPAASVRP
jgi:large subunit ribosomal protein L24